MVSNIFHFYPYLGKWSNLNNIFQRGWNHQLGMVSWCCYHLDPPISFTWIEVVHLHLDWHIPFGLGEEIGSSAKLLEKEAQLLSGKKNAFCLFIIDFKLLEASHWILVCMSPFQYLDILGFSETTNNVSPTLRRSTLVLFVRWNASEMDEIWCNKCFAVYSAGGCRKQRSMSSRLTVVLYPFTMLWRMIQLPYGHV